MSGLSIRRPRWQQVAAALGFQVPVLFFALRTALAAFAALAIAQVAGLEYPHWAAMSVWASSQPMREHLLARSMYRFAGSVVGVAYAVALVLLAQDSLWVLAVGMALWGALCAFWGNVQRGYLVYGCMLAGYSAAMVVLLHQGPADTITHFAWDRMWTVVIGVATALCMSWCFAPKRKAAVLIAQSRSALAGVLQATASQIRQPSTALVDGYAECLGRLAAVEAMLELYPEGSRSARHTARAIHAQQHYALELLYQLALPVDTGMGHGGAVQHQHRQAVAYALEQLARILQADPVADAGSEQAVQQALRQALQACESAVAQAATREGGAMPPAVLDALHALLQAMRRGLRAESRDLRLPARQPVRKGRAERLPLHKDWVGAKEAAVRAGATLLVVGVLWAWTQASVVGFAMLGLATMLLVFSAFESPSRTMAFVLRGQLIGAGLALLCQSLVWPLAQSSWQMVWMILPFALLGGLVFAHQRTAVGAMDTNMAMFILLAPVFPDTAGMGKHISYALAVVAGPALAWVMYRMIYPTDARRRMQTLARMMLNDIPVLARRLLSERSGVNWSSGGWLPELDSAGWQAQLHHRLLRLLSWAKKTQLPALHSLPHMGLALRSMHTAMLQLQQWRTETVLATPALRRTARCAELALRRTAQWDSVDGQAEVFPKLQAAWSQLAQQSALPAPLAAQLQCVAQRDLAALQSMRALLRTRA